MLLGKELAEAALHRACCVLDQSLLQLGDIVFGLTTRDGVIGNRCNGLDTVSFVECLDLVGHEHCAIGRDHPPGNAEHHKGRTQHSDGRC